MIQQQEERNCIVRIKGTVQHQNTKIYDSPFFITGDMKASTQHANCLRFLGFIWVSVLMR